MIDAAPMSAEATPSKAPIEELEQVSIPMPIDKGSPARATPAPEPASVPEAPATNPPTPKVTGLSLLAAKPGESIAVLGNYFRPGLSVKIAGRTTLALTILSASQAAFALPQNTPPGLIHVEVQDQGDSLGKFSLVSDSANDDIPIMLADPQLICTSITFRDAKGQVRKGERECFDEPPYKACKGDGDTNCTLGQDLIALKKINLDPAVIRLGTTLGGVVGTLVPTPGPCTKDGGVQCVANSAYPAVDAANLSATNIRLGVTMANVAGTLEPSPALCDKEGTSGCVASSRFVTVDLNRLQPDMIKQGIAIAGVSGSVIPSPSFCAADGATSCVANAAYVAANSSTLTPGNIRSGVAVGGVTGQFPSSSYPLSGNSSIPDLDAASFDARLKTGARFQWFDAGGRRYEREGDPRLTAEHILNGISIFGTTGTVLGALPCMRDGDSQCVVTDAFKASDTSKLESVDLRMGRTVAGISGSLDFFKNMANTTLYDRTAGAGSQPGLDVYDTIDDHANNTGFPNQVPPGFTKASGSHWVRDAASDDGLAGGTAADGLCNGGETCLVKDRLSGLLWTRGDTTQRTWESAISYCETLNYGGFMDWRLPTQKELMQAYVDGIWSQKGASKLSLMSYVWSATSVSYSTTAAWLVYLNYGSIAATNKTSNGYALCVR